MSEPPARPFVRVRGRSFIAFVLAPEPPVADWVAELDAQIARSPNFFRGRPIILDASALRAGDPGLGDLPEALLARGIRLIAAEGVDPAWPGAAAWPPMMNGGRPAGFVEIADETQEAPAEPREPTSLLVGETVRSGQSVVFPGGDVTVVGSVASGAEVIAGGSIHVYGALRGRAVAGLLGGAARIFCRRFEAELLAIDGRYKTIDDGDAALRGRAVQAWLDGDSMRMAALD